MVPTDAHAGLCFPSWFAESKRMPFCTCLSVLPRVLGGLGPRAHGVALLHLLFPPPLPTFSILFPESEGLFSLCRDPSFLFSFTPSIFLSDAPIPLLPTSRVYLKSFLLQKAFLPWNDLKVPITPSARITCNIPSGVFVYVCLCEVLNHRLWDAAI